MTRLHTITTRLRAIAALTLAAAVAPALAQPIEGCPPSATLTARFDEFGRTGKMPPDLGQWIGNTRAQTVEPFKAFDNVDYVGICWVSAWIVRTSDGPVLIDTLHEPHVDTLLANLRKVGVDPASIRYVLMTHGHIDHVGGAARLKPLMPQARFVMTRTGWDEGLASARKSESTPRPWKMLEPDIVVKDGDTITVGDTAFRVFETPGHTFGTASYEYVVRDGDRRHVAFTVGGLGLNAIENSKQVEAFIASVRRIEQLVERRPEPVTVHLTTHPFSNGLFEAARGIPGRKAGEPHPLVDPAGFASQLRVLREGAQERLVVERKAGR